MNAPLPIVLPLIAFALLLLAGLFAMAETAILALRPSRVDQMIEEGRRGATSVKRLTEDPPRHIATAQVGVTLLGFAATAVSVTDALLLTEPRDGAAPVPFATRVMAVAAATAITALAAMVVAGLVPKSVAMEAPDAWALRLAPFVRFCAVLFRPLSAVVLAVSGLLATPFGARARFQTPLITREEFGQIIDSTGRLGEIDDDEAQIITRVIEFSETDVRTVMTPRIDMSALPIDADLERTVEIILASGHSRVPVYEGTIDNIVGILHAKDLLPLLAGKVGREGFDLRAIVRAPFFIAESESVSDLLSSMRRSNHQLAIVQDEYAGTEGLVTIEDLLEEIVGDIKDEYDRDEPELKVLSETETLLDGRVTIDEVNDRLGTELSDEDYRTIGGYVQGALGHDPSPGDRIEAEGVVFVVDRIEGRRVMLRAIREVGGDDLPDGA